MVGQILAETFKELYQRKMTTSSGGNISMKDPDNQIWISPSGKDKGYLDASDFIKICEDGSCAATQKVSMETPFHLALYKAFPQVKVVCHIHPINFVALSLVPESRIIEILEKLNLGYAGYAIPGSVQLGEYIVSAFSIKPRAVVMQNHGLILVGEEMSEVLAELFLLSSQLNELVGFKSDQLSINQHILSKVEDQEFYTQRIQSYLKTEGKITFTALNSVNPFQLKLKLSSLIDLNKEGIVFKAKLIPESFIILRKIVVKDEVFTEIKFESYLQELNVESPMMIFKSGDVIITGNTLYQIYDRLEVLDFSIQVLRKSLKIGIPQFLSVSQIEELRERFLT